MRENIRERGWVFTHPYSSNFLFISASVGEIILLHRYKLIFFLIFMIENVIYTVPGLKSLNQNKFFRILNVLIRNCTK